MGYFFRRSARLGPIRLNFSKSGIGASVGVKGARLTMTPRGTTYVTVGSHGFYYRETLSSRGHARGSAIPPATVPPPTASADEIVTAGVSDLVDSSNERLLQQLNERAKMANPAVFPYVGAGLSFVFGLTNNPAFLILAVVLVVAGVVLQNKNREKRLTRLFYELDAAAQQNKNIVQQALAHLAQSQRIWRIEGEAATSDWKRNAGASALVRRTAITVASASPPRVEANIPLPCINMGTMRLFFLPDVILCWQSGNFGAIAYTDFRIEQGVTRFIEAQGAPGDATVVGWTWRYVNKSGGPDRRFNNNVQLPILHYGVLQFSSSKGLNIHVNTSSAEASLAFTNCWRTLYERISPQQQYQPPPPPPPRERTTPSSAPKAQALKTLGLSDGASDAEISAAYRHLAQMYHPDKVAGLGPELRVLADTKMKEINGAYEILKHSG